MTSDSHLQAHVLEMLQGDAHTAPTAMAVSVTDGVVTLTGEVDCLAKRVAAVRAAEQAHGVRAVVDKMVVCLPTDQWRSDADLAHAAVSALAWDTEVPDDAIKARVQDRWIWLIGEADWHYQRLAAERAVENIAGLKGVTNLVRIKKRVQEPELRSQIERAFARSADLAARKSVV